MLTVYYVSWCPICTKAINFIRDKRLRHKLVNVDDFNGKDEVFRLLKNNTDMEKSHKTVPAIFHNGKFIGGCEELLKIF